MRFRSGRCYLFLDGRQTYGFCGRMADNFCFYTLVTPSRIIGMVPDVLALVLAFSKRHRGLAQ